jgi:putative transposase
LEKDNTKELGRVVHIDEGKIRGHLDEMVRGTVEQTLNDLLDAEADRLCNAPKYARSPDRVDSRAGHYERKLLTKAGEVKLKVPKLREAIFETAIIERYKRRESSVEEAMIEMYLAGVSVRRVESITEALWGAKVSPGTVSKLNKRIYGHIEKWRNAAHRGELPLCVSGRRGAKAKLGRRGAQHLRAGGYWRRPRWLPHHPWRGRRSQRGQSRLEQLSQIPERARPHGRQAHHLRRLPGPGGINGRLLPEAKWQRCTVHFYRNVFSHVPRGKVAEVARMLKAIHAQEDLAAAKDKVQAVVKKLRGMKLKSAADLVEKVVEQTLTYYHFPSEHWRRIRTNNPMERIIREIRRRTRVVGAFPDGESALMLVAARLRHIASTKWSTRKYLNMELLNYDNHREALAD